MKVTLYVHHTGHRMLVVEHHSTKVTLYDVQSAAEESLIQACIDQAVEEYVITPPWEEAMGSYVALYYGR